MVTCPQCGQENPAAARFCSNCGAGLAVRPEPKEERKLVSILFVDLVGFTSRSDRADPEDVRDTLQLYHSRAKEQIERYGGTLEKFVGDAVMAVFGAPVAHGDDAERAARAGLRVLRAIDDLNGDRPGLDLAARAAVATGEAVVTVGSAPELGQALAMGDVVNTASRLQSAAPPGRLIVGEETHRATRNVIRYEPLDAVVAKGKREPVPAWLAIEPIQGPAQATAASDLVGRDQEMALLRSIWERAVMEGHPHLVTVLGPPGLGKSRLAGEFSSHVEDWGHRVLRGRCLPYEASDVYGPFAQQVKHLAGIFEQDPPETARERIASLTGGLVPEEETADITRALSLFLGLGLDEPMDERTLMFFSARRFLEHLSARQPTLLIFEDVHWATSGQLDLIEYLTARARESAVMLLALARPELLDTRPTWGSGKVPSSTIVLEALPPAASRRIAARLVGDAVSAADLERLVDVAEGNPLFVEELAASLAEGMQSGAALPTTVRVAIASRIDALPAEERATLLDASVVGKVFWRGALTAMGRDAVDQTLDALEGRDLIRREATSRMRGDAEYLFKHVLIRDVAYGTLARPDRRTRHAAVARYVEAMAGEQVRDIAWLLAHHWREAGEPERAIGYLLLAAEAARDSWATQEAVRLYDGALELATDEATRIRIQLARGLGLARLEEFDQAVEVLGELLPQLDGIDRVEALLSRGRSAQWTEQTEVAIDMAEEAIALAERMGARQYLGPGLGRLSQALAMRGDPGDLDRATGLGDRALEIWVPETTSNYELAEHNVLHAHTYYWMGRYAEGIDLARAGRAIAVISGSREALLRGGSMEGASLAAMGRYEEAIAVFEERIALGREMGRPVSVILNYSTLALRDIYDLDEARRRNEEASEHTGWSSFNMPWQNALVDLVFTDLLAGDIGSAEARWTGAWEEVSQGKAWQRWYLAGKMTAARAEIALHAGSPEVAAEWAHRAIDMAVPVGRRKYEAAARAVLGQALAAMGRLPEAVAELETAVREADRLGTPPGRWRTRAALGTALYTAGRDEEAERTFQEAVQIIRGVAASLSKERGERFLNAPAIREILGAER